MTANEVVVIFVFGFALGIVLIFILGWFNVVRNLFR